MFRNIHWKVAIPLALLIFIGMAILEFAWGSATFAAILTVTAVSVLSAVLCAVLVARIVTARVKQITEVAQQITAGEPGHAIYAGADDEIGQLARAFNEMSARLREFVDTVSDEKSALAAVLNSITDSIIMTDPEGSIVLANPAAERSFNFTLSKAQGKRLIEVIQDYHVSDLLKRCLTTASELTAEIDTSNGLFLRVIAVPMTTSKNKGALLLFQDFTEMRTLQTTRKEFIGNVSHDLRTPLAGIKAIVETLQDGAIDDREVALDFLGKIDTEVNGMTQMVAELIELSRMETGKVTLNLELASLNHLIEDSVSRITPQAARQGLTISTDLAADLPDIEIDSERVSHVITNILHNAIKFTHPGGKILVSTTLDGDSVITRITDTGIGISKRDLPHIFERFFKADRSRASGGTGLGLAIAKHTIQIHGGKIWVETEEGRGSTFSFSLPVHKAS